tara:strand:- start:209 stop:442 length:234 start_codon:yes stop_codon:yes gene_type:complete
MAEDHSQEKFAADVAGIIITFMDGITAVKNLEDYYLANKSPIEKVRNISQDKYDELIQAFKNKKKEILEKEVETITK